VRDRLPHPGDRWTIHRSCLRELPSHRFLRFLCSCTYLLATFIPRMFSPHFGVVVPLSLTHVLLDPTTARFFLVLLFLVFIYPPFALYPPPPVRLPVSSHPVP
ncbi:unnamed protein product, partial [Ectocarpus sp. 4 AP-2014]